MKKYRKYIFYASILLNILLILCLFILCVCWGTNEKEDKNTGSTVSDGWYYVSGVIDGDTIRIAHGGQNYSVRLIGVDTPEVKSPYREQECYGEEASSFLKEKLEGKEVYLESDATQSDIDKYGRLLRYVWVDNELANKMIIESGFGRESTYNTYYKKRTEFIEAEQNAKDKQIGIWNAKTCEGWESN